MLERSSPAPRGPRNGSRNSTPSIRGRGGISKRKSTPTRADRDGDLEMDAAATGSKGRFSRGGDNVFRGGRGAGRGGGGLGRASKVGILKTQQAIMRGLGAEHSQANISDSQTPATGTQLRIDGLSLSKAATNPDGGVEAMLAFLERKATERDTQSRPVKIKKSLKKGDSVIITASPADIIAIKKLDQFTFAGAVLSMHEIVPESKEAIRTKAEETKEQLRAVLSSRYDSENKLLNLASLAQDPGLISMGVFDGTTTTSKIFPALMVVCDGLFKTNQDKREAVLSVTLADNSLVNVSDVEALARTFPDLKNLDLSRNQLADLKSLDAWGRRFRKLTTLILSENPIEPQLPALKPDLVKKYPHLEILNGFQFRTPEEIAADLEAAKYPIPLAAPDFRDVGQVGENFVRQFVALYDSNRSALLSTFYDDKSTFSINVNMTAPRGANNSTVIAPWGPYTRHSRNLVKINNLPTQMNRLHRGAQAINTVWSSLPATRHPDLQTQTDKYLIECHSLPGLADPTGQSLHGVDGLIVIINGEFEEQSDKTDKALRSFSRTFVLGPGGPGGPPIRVVSDMMTLRAWGPLATPRVGATPPSASIAIAAPVLTEQQQQEAIAVQLVEKTGLMPHYAMLCLTETGWDLEKAFVAFNENRHKLPAEAFANGNFR